jgi:polyferredoxin
MLNPLQNFLLVFNMIDMLAFYDFSLFHAFDGIFVAWLCFLPTYTYITESTYILTLKSHITERKERHKGKYSLSLSLK